MSRALATTAAVLGVVAALAAAVLWTAGRETLDEDRFATQVVASLTSPAGRQALTETLVRRLEAPGSGRASAHAALIADARAAVTQVVRSPAFDDLLAAALAETYHAVVAHPGDEVAIDLGALSGSLADRLEPVYPALAARLRADPRLSVTITTGFGIPALPLNRLVGRVPLLTGLLALASAALVAAALALSRDPGRTARRLAVAFALCALVPAAIRLAVPRVAADVIDPPADQLARELAAGLLSPWLLATSALAVAAAALLALGRLRAGAGPRIRPRAG